VGILIVGHGSREERSNQEFETFVSAYRLTHPGRSVRFAYIELAKPDVKIVLIEFAKTHKQITIIPLFLFASGHVKNDIPLIIHELQPRFPGHRFLVSQTIGVHPLMIELMMERMSSISALKPGEQGRTGVVVVGRGASDVDANGDFHKLVRFFEEGNRYSFVLPTFIGITKPLLQDTLEMAAKFRPDRLLVLPYFLFGGRLIGKIQKQCAEFTQSYPWIRTEIVSYLGADPKIFEILNERMRDAEKGVGALPCVTCEYRHQMPGLPHRVGGLKAMLWSLRHLETHSQSGPHEFPHKNLKKHVLVCENVDCAGRGSTALIGRMRSLIKEQGAQSDFKVTRTSCMGRCGEGPAVVVYPDGIWYQNVQLSDVQDIVQGHLMNDRIVSRIVDNIMQ
jgi:sirohydrochlorin cobaltochelatase